ncbi:Transcriptional regulatory protein ZraR [Planctomycetes bacterium MalM25]|nr:Transcriptional regulatory protein ZraR [Planctomycetes bacterium MalM25]
MLSETVLANSIDPESPSTTVLVIDSDPLVSTSVRRALEGIEHRLHTAADSHTGMEAVESKRPDLVVLDNLLPDRPGLHTLAMIRELAPSVPVLFVSAPWSGEVAIEAMKLSALDCLPKPLEPVPLRESIARALKRRSVLPSPPHQEDSQPHIPDLGAETLPLGLIGRCRPMQSVLKALGKVAGLDAPVLVRGEHGTGELAVAREIHKRSRDSEGPCLTVSCGSWDERGLTEALFGDQQGRSGSVTEAASGTLVLQEVDALPPRLQTRVLQAIRGLTYKPTSVTGEPSADCRIIATTNEDLEAKTRSGEFRSGLYYALTSYVIELPPLRQRRNDLPELVEHLLGHASEACESRPPRVSDEVMQALSNHLWPGNFDELESVLKRSMAQQNGDLLLASELFPAAAESVIAAGTEGSSNRESTDWRSFVDLRVEGGAGTLHAEAVADTEQKVFKRVLRHTRGNQAQAARVLGITRASLRKKLRMYGMAPRPVDGLD